MTLIAKLDTATAAMVDLETTGLYAGCCILSIGATTLDMQHTFYSRINWDSCIEAGLVDLPSTMAWWKKQSQEALDEVFNPDSPALAKVLADFNAWLQQYKIQTIWGNGADFDNPILAAAYRAVAIEPAYPKFGARCYRTVKSLYPQVVTPAFEGVKHNALADAQHQARHLNLILERM